MPKRISEKTTEQSIVSQKFITTWFYASKDSETQDVGIFRTKIKKIYDNRSVDFDEFSQRLEEAYNNFDERGYDVINIVPIAMGSSEQCKQSNGNYVGDVGFSLTRGAVVVGKRRD
jgi:hypothetical protein